MAFPVRVIGDRAGPASEVDAKVVAEDEGRRAQVGHGATPAHVDGFRAARRKVERAFVGQRAGAAVTRSGLVAVEPGAL